MKECWDTQGWCCGGCQQPPQALRYFLKVIMMVEFHFMTRLSVSGRETQKAYILAIEGFVGSFRRAVCNWCNLCAFYIISFLASAWSSCNSFIIAGVVGLFRVKWCGICKKTLLFQGCSFIWGWDHVILSWPGSKKLAVLDVGLPSQWCWHVGVVLTLETVASQTRHLCWCCMGQPFPKNFGVYGFLCTGKKDPKGCVTWKSRSNTITTYQLYNVKRFTVSSKKKTLRYVWMPSVMDHDHVEPRMPKASLCSTMTSKVRHLLAVDFSQGVGAS